MSFGRFPAGPQAPFSQEWFLFFSDFFHFEMMKALLHLNVAESLARPASDLWF